MSMSNNNLNNKLAAQDKPSERYLSEKECVALANRAKGMAVGGGDMALSIETYWRGNIRFAKNELISGGDLRTTRVYLTRDIFGAKSRVVSNQIDDIGLEAAVRRSERMLANQRYSGGRQFRTHYKGVDSLGLEEKRDERVSSADVDAVSALVQTIEPYSKPKLFFDTTYALEAPNRLAAVKDLIPAVEKHGLLAAGYIEAGADGRAVIDTVGRSLYYPFTTSEYSITVRTPEGTGSGWAGVDFSDWTRIDAEKITNTALEKCLRSKNPVAVEPGRYTAILEPQATHGLMDKLVAALNTRPQAEKGHGPFAMRGGDTKIGLKVLDDRISITSDPMDPDIGFPPFDINGHVYHNTTWIEKGVLQNLAYSRSYGIKELGINSGMPSIGAYRMSGGTATLDDMVASTKRGIYVTRFSNVGVRDYNSVLCTGYTRDGLWLVENGKITKAIKNFMFLESPLFIFNNLETLGVPEKVYSPYRPAVAPPAKVRDFSFTSLIEAI